MTVKNFVLVFGVVLLTGCMTGRGLVAPLPDNPDPTQAAKITVKRDRSFLASAQSMLLTIDGHDYWKLVNGAEHSFLLTPGTHFFGVKCVGGWRMWGNFHEIEREVDAGKQYYFRIHPSGGDGCSIEAASS